jgi:hypothetical protein
LKGKLDVDWRIILGCEDTDWIDVAEHRIQLGAHANRVTDVGFEVLTAVVMKSTIF